MALSAPEIIPVTGPTSTPETESPSAIASVTLIILLCISSDWPSLQPLIASSVLRAMVLCVASDARVIEHGCLAALPHPESTLTGKQTVAKHFRVGERFLVLS